MKTNKKFKNLFKSLSLIIALVVLISACSKAKEQKDQLQIINERGHLIVGVKFDSKPFGFLDEDQKLKGFDIELSQEIAKRLLGSKKAIKFKQVTASNRIFSLSSGAVDFIAATMTISDRRRQIVNFSDPYYNAGMAIMISKSSEIKIAKDLNGLKVAVVLGSTGEKNLRLLAPKCIVQGFRTYTDAYTALKAGRVDAITTDDAILTGFLFEDDNYKILKQRYTNEPYGLAFRKGKNSEALRNTVNSILNEIKADGTLNKIRKKWMVDALK